MRSQAINQKKIYYAVAIKGGATDKNGNKVLSYADPVPARFSFGVYSGEAENQPFGKNVDYEADMLTHDMKCPIDEYTRLWVNADPKKEPYDFIVKKKAPSLNCIRYAIKQVTT